MRKVFGHNHGVMVANQFYESVYLHDLQQRPLALGEREQSMELVFTPRTRQELFNACLWTLVEGDGDDPAFYTFAAITDDPPPEVASTGHDRFLVPIREENIDAWLDPDAKNLGSLLAILEDKVKPYYEHELVKKE